MPTTRQPHHRGTATAKVQSAECRVQITFKKAAKSKQTSHFDHQMPCLETLTTILVFMSRQVLIEIIAISNVAPVAPVCSRHFIHASILKIEYIKLHLYYEESRNYELDTSQVSFLWRLVLLFSRIEFVEFERLQWFAEMLVLPLRARFAFDGTTPFEGAIARSCHEDSSGVVATTAAQ
ncbi:hypothetical protein OUZ56_020688 [Daphnia magna]|uniref:Uncharacterized protein n=1 Tax=Daphnia magna TaxID=35525 RepID=A0ABQ9ZF63_9CRUS|nr:hypothetical protein OUZ56_020688 [Daphnia magna]